MDRSGIPLTRVAVKELIPLQTGLSSKTVAAKRQAMRDGEAVDAPLVFKANDQLYVGDGHHTVEAAFLEGYSHVKVRIIDLGDVPLEKLAKALVQHTGSVADPHRPLAVKQEKRLKNKIKPVLSALGDAVADSFEAHDPVTKAKKPKDPPDNAGWWIEDAAVEAWMADSILTLIAAGDLKLTIALEEGLTAVGSDAGSIMLAAMMPDDYESLVNVVDRNAVAYARERAGELIGKNARGTGELAETTRKRIRAAITNGLEENIGRDGITDLLRDDFAFSDARAQLIAGTEIAHANGHSSHQGLLTAQATGLTIEHSWICEETACQICLDNEAQGWIPVDDKFASGDLNPTAHPNCRCAEAARVVEPAVKMALSSITTFSSMPNHQHPETGTGVCHGHAA